MGQEISRILYSNFLNYIGIPVKGFVQPGVNRQKDNLCFSIEEVSNCENRGILIAESLNPYYLLEREIRNFFFISDKNRRNINIKMQPKRSIDMYIEYNLVDHCNLNCRSCDHFAPLAQQKFCNLELFETDIRKLAEICNDDLKALYLLGGEPLLHPDIEKCLSIAKKYFVKTSINLFTNGTLLLKKDQRFWELIKELDIFLNVTEYPINFYYDEVDAIARKYSIRYSRFTSFANQNDKSTKMMVRHPFLLSDNYPIHEFISCYHFNECITLRDGKIFTCPLIPYSKHFF